LILTGVIFGFIFSSMVLFLIAVVNPEKMHSSLIWLTGDLSSTDTSLIKIVAVVTLAGVCVLYYFSRELNVLSLGEEKASNSAWRPARSRNWSS